MYAIIKMPIPTIRKSCANPYNEHEYADGANGKLTFVPTEFELKVKEKFEQEEQWEIFCMLPLSEDQKRDLLSKCKK